MGNQTGPPRPLAALKPLAAFAGWGTLLTLALSTQLLFQPFVWRNWPWDEVLSAWFELAWHRLAVASSIAVLATLAWKLPVRSTAARALLCGGAILLGAGLGEWALIASGSLEAPADAPAVAARMLQWAMLSASLAGVLLLWHRSSSMQAEAQALELRQVKTERQVVEARLQALRSQIEPHFLFNTLATVRRLQHTREGGGAQLLSHFLDYLRCTLPDAQHRGSTLGDEVNLMRAYLAVVAVRMEGRLSVVFDVPSALCDCEFPPLAAATLVENAIKHGISPSPRGGAILVQARETGALLEVLVVDTGVGFPAEATGGSGIGLANIRARLHTLYGQAGSLQLSQNHGGGVRASIRMPRLQPAQVRS